MILKWPPSLIPVTMAMQQNTFYKLSKIIEDDEKVSKYLKLSGFENQQHHLHANRYVFGSNELH